MYRRSRTAVSLVTIATIALANCGGDDDDASPATEPPDSETTTAPTAAPTAAPATTAGSPDTTEDAGSEPLIALAETDLGEVIVAADGLTLYMFEPDAAGKPTCTGACAGTWPPYYVEDGSELTAGDGLDPGLLGLVAHPEGGDMLKYGDWPLYYYAGDQAPGDTNGQGVNGIWWVVDNAGEPIQNAGLAANDPDVGFSDY
jgi:predicted lipoprotein with Yx(FWY)xxD motif